MKITNYSFYVILLFVSIALFHLTFPEQAIADGVSLKISPSIIRIETKPPADVWAPFTIENQSGQPVSLKIGYKPFDPILSQNGSVVFLPDGQPVTGPDKKIFEKMQVVDTSDISHDSIDLGPGQKEQFRLRINLPSNEPRSDYYFSLIFIEAPSKVDQSITQTTTEVQKSYSTLQAGIGMNVLLAVGDKEIPQGSIDSFTTPWFQTSGPVPFTLTVHNSGTHFIAPHGTILIKNMFGQAVGKVAIPSSVLLAGTSRTFTSNASQVTANNASLLGVSESHNASHALLWPQHFLLGFYTATISLSLGDNSPVFTRNLSFFALPVNLFLEIILIVAIISYIFLRVKRKIS